MTKNERILAISRMTEELNNGVGVVESARKHFGSTYAFYRLVSVAERESMRYKKPVKDSVNSLLSTCIPLDKAKEIKRLARKKGVTTRRYLSNLIIQHLTDLKK